MIIETERKCKTNFACTVNCSFLVVDNLYNTNEMQILRNQFADVDLVKEKSLDSEPQYTYGIPSVQDTLVSSRYKNVVCVINKF